MKKLISVITLLCLLGCAPIQTNSLQGEIVEIGERSVLINHSDNGLIEAQYDDAIDYRIGDKIEILYHGQVKETFPAQVSAEEINLIKEAFAYLEIVGVENNELSFYFMTQQEYYYLMIGARIEFYEDLEWVDCLFTSAGCGMKDLANTDVVKIPLELYELKGSGKYRLTYTLYDEQDNKVMDVFNYFNI